MNMEEATSRQIDWWMKCHWSNSGREAGLSGLPEGMSKGQFIEALVLTIHNIKRRNK